MKKFNGKRARPIPDKRVYSFIKKNLSIKFLYDNKIVQNFLTSFYKWIQKSKLNKISGIKKFSSLSFVHGTSQAFDDFYREYGNRRFRCFKGDFAYHKIIWKNRNNKWTYLEEGKLEPFDAVVISVPFSDSGSIHPKTRLILKQCEKLKIPVLLDFAYYLICRNININVDLKCIKVLTFSLSKAFYGAERLRIGLRCKRTKDYDPPDLFTEMGMVSKISAGIGLKLIKKYKTDYCQKKYREKQIKICQKLNIVPSDCAIFGLANKSDKRYKFYNRGTEWRRVCISRQLGDMKDLSK